jgi:hypothetical protein
MCSSGCYWESRSRTYLGLAEDDVAVSVGRFVDLWVVNNDKDLNQAKSIIIFVSAYRHPRSHEGPPNRVTKSTHVLGPPHDDSVDTLDLFQTQLKQSLAGFSLIATHVGLDGDISMVVTLVVGVVGVVVDLLDRHGD